MQNTQGWAAFGMRGNTLAGCSGRNDPKLNTLAGCSGRNDPKLNTVSCLDTIPTIMALLLLLFLPRER